MIHADDSLLFERGPSHSRITNITNLFELLDSEARIILEKQRFERFEKESLREHDAIRFNQQPRESKVDRLQIDLEIMEKVAKKAFELNDIRLTDMIERLGYVTSVDGLPTFDIVPHEGIKIENVTIFDRINSIASIIGSVPFFDRIESEAWTRNDSIFTEMIEKIAREDHMLILADWVQENGLTIKLDDDVFANRMESETYNGGNDIIYVSTVQDIALIDTFDKRMSKTNQEAWVNHAPTFFDRTDKVSLVTQYWNIVQKTNTDAYLANEDIQRQLSDMMSKEVINYHKLVDGEKFIKDMKNTLVIKYLQAHKDKLDSFFQDLITYANREESFESIIRKMTTMNMETERIGIHQNIDFGSRETNIAILTEMINATDNSEKRDGYILQPFALNTDSSHWENIWGAYSPGKDILDMPDSDFDYSKLANQVYDPKTGVPYEPLSSLNSPDVKVKRPLHHPLPDFYDVGIDDSKVLLVDNYIFMDTVISIDALRTRNTLRYAGMPAEKTMRELFSKLFTWIQQSTPGSDEYERMFRFCRWYGESAVLQLSEHILHRTYNSWRSNISSGSGLGVPYTSIGWVYYPTAYIMQTNSNHSELHFEKENYIDGQIILRGYFDNPLSQGKMEVYIDDSLVDTISTNGAFSRTYDVIQGNHNYDIVFDGTSGTVSLSNVEISGCEFISAYTTSDDSNTNGLKAVSSLIDMLLAYFDQHWGHGKTKGTMEVKQRRVWNTQT
jgi:hypothetical protein